MHLKGFNRVAIQQKLTETKEVCAVEIRGERDKTDGGELSNSKRMARGEETVQAVVKRGTIKITAE